jgi:hypothetical protein
VKEVIDRKSIHEVLQRCSALANGSWILNLDETRISAVPKKLHVLTLRGLKQVP